ncbi:MAG: PAS domain S-box protein, partial [Elusimicrobiaceae bacterium]
MESDTEPGIFISLSMGSGQTDKESVDDTYLYLQRIIKLNQAMMSAIPIPVFYKDRQGRYIACNKAFTEFLGVTEEQIKGKTVLEVWPEQHAEDYHQRDLAIMDSPERQIYEYKLWDKNGQYHPIIYAKDVFRDENDQVAGIVSTFIDITDRKRAEEMVLESEERFRRIFEDGPIGMVIANVDCTFSRVNSAFCKMLGYVPHELLGLTPMDITHSENLPSNISNIQQLIAGEISVYKTEKRYIRKDGSYVWADTTATAIRDKNDKCLYTLTMIEDITDRKKYEAEILKLNSELEARVSHRTRELKLANEKLEKEVAERKLAEAVLRESEEKFRDMTEITSDWLWEVNTEAAYTYVNSKVRDILGYEPEEILGKTPFDFMSPEEIKRVGPVFESYTKQKKSFSFLVNNNIHKDGHLVVLETSGVPIFDENNVFRGYRGIDRDITEHKAAENVLRESEEKFRNLFESSRDMLMILDEGGRVIECNPASCKMFGYTAQEMLGITPWDVSPKFQPDGTPSKEGALEKVKQALAGKTEPFEWVNIRKDGTPIYVEVIISPMELGGKKVVQIIDRDITERKLAEKGLRESEAKFKNLFESSRDAIMILADGKFADCNPATLNMFGYSKDEFCKITPWDVSPEVQANGTPSKVAAMEKINKTLEGHSAPFEWIHIRKDGTPFFADITLSPMDLNGKKAVQAIVRDMTKYKAMQREIMETKKKLQTVLDTVDVAVYEKDKDGRYTLVNRKYESAIGIKQAGVIGKTDAEFFPPEAAKLFAEEDRRVKDEQTAISFEEDIPNVKNGACRSYLTTKVPLLDENGNVRSIIGQSTDITDLIKMQYQLRAAKEEAEGANRAKSEFLANMSHEIRTPLNTVIGMNHLVLDTKLTQKQKEYIRKSSTAAKALLQLINDILDFSKIEAGKLTTEKIPFSLQEVMNESAEITGLKAEEKGLELMFDVDRSIPDRLMGDPLRLSQILNNLISNAIKFTPQGEIIIGAGIASIKANKIELLFSVRDSGIGMTEGQLENLFSPFTQADGSMTRKYGGTGLGLAISKQLTQLMGGTISAESKFNEGSVFTFILPFEISDGKPEPRVNFEPEPDLRGKKVLIADDSANAREILTKMLESMSFRPNAVASGMEMLEVLRRMKYEIVILDWKMPGLDGIETARRIKEEHLCDSPKILMVSAYSKGDLLREGEKAGIDAFIPKPVYPSVLFDSIMQLFGKNRVAHRKEKRIRERLDAEHLKYLRGLKVLLAEDQEINQQVACEILKKAGLKVTLANNGKEAVDLAAKQKFDLIFLDLQMPVMDGLTATGIIRELDLPYAKT